MPTLIPEARTRGLRRPRPDARQLKDLRNIGPAMLKDFAVLGIKSVAQLAHADAHRHYLRLQRKTNKRHDPCVWNVFAAAIPRGPHRRASRLVEIHPATQSPDQIENVDSRRRATLKVWALSISLCPILRPTLFVLLSIRHPEPVEGSVQPVAASDNRLLKFRHPERSETCVYSFKWAKPQSKDLYRRTRA